MADQKKYSAKRQLSPADLKAFRHDVARLKKSGLIKPSIDARSARPYMLSNGRTLAEIVNNANKPVTSLAKFGEPITVKDVPGVKHRSLAGLLKDLQENKTELDSLKKPDERFGFRIAGTDSIATFDDIELLLDFLQESEGVRTLYHKRSDGKQVYNTLQIIRWNRDQKAWTRHRRVKGLTQSQLARQAKYRRKKKG